LRAVNRGSERPESGLVTGAPAQYAVAMPALEGLGIALNGFDYR